MPDWLHDIFLGYGDPAQAKYTHMPADQLLQTIDFKVQLQLRLWSSVAAANFSVTACWTGKCGNATSLLNIVMSCCHMIVR